MGKPVVLLTSIGGPAADNVRRAFWDLPYNICPSLIGVDCDELMLRLSRLYGIGAYKIPSAYDVKAYVLAINRLCKEHGVTMIYPQSDLEVRVCSANRENLVAPMTLPNHETIETCQDKGKLYEFLDRHSFPVPKFKLPSSNDIQKLMLAEYGNSPNYGAGYGWDKWYPCWLRARRGAGGNKSLMCKDWRDFMRMAGLYPSTEWMLVEPLRGRDYSFTSLWHNGTLITSVLKERLRWVYNRIGTTAVQRTISNFEIIDDCREIIKKLEPNISGIMMIDLKEDSEGNYYVAEINAGRLGTVSYWFARASQEYYGDHRVNFPYLLYKLHHRISIEECVKAVNALPLNTWLYRHIDMGSRLTFENGEEVRF